MSHFRNLKLVLGLVGTSFAVNGEISPKGLSSTDWTNIRAEYQRNRHAAFAVGGEYHARNHSQQWLTRFDGRGFTVIPDATGWRWGLQLQSYGVMGHEQAVNGVAKVTANRQRITYTWDSTVEEWFVNGLNGLEHGYILRRRPTKQAASIAPVRFHLEVRGDLHPVANSGGRGISFLAGDGGVAVQYAGLAVWDADGKSLPAHLTALNNAILLEVDDRAARYPITIDPVAQQAYLKASNPEGADGFGVSVAISGDTVVVGANSESSGSAGVNGDQSDNSVSTAGAAYVFVRNGTTWTQQAYLKASNPGVLDNFGLSVGIDGDTIVVGAYFESSNATGIDGNQANDSAMGAGAAYVFVRNGTTWSQQAYLKASNTNTLDLFGNSVAISGETLIVGAPFEASNATGIDGDEGNNSATAAGAAYVFVRNGTTWSQQAYLKASNTGSNDVFGSVVAISGDTIVVGASAEDSNATGVDGNQSNESVTNSGAAYVFTRNSNVWSQQAYLKASNTDASDGFGGAVAISGDTILVGASTEDSKAKGVNGNSADNTASNSGAAYVFVRNSGVWTQQAYLKASNTAASDDFGNSVGLSGDLAVVGAHQEDSSAKGIGGNQANNSASNSGAAYLFERTGTVWAQKAYLKASNTQASDNFGVSVAIDGDTVVVGADREDSSSAGVNGNQNNNSASSAGAAYVYLNTPGPCTFTVNLTLAPNTLSPADHRLVEVTAKLKVNPCVNSPSVKLLSITSNEPDAGIGGGDLPNDIQQANIGTDDRKFLLRAERKPSSGPPDVVDNNNPPGRTYTATYEVKDAGNVKKTVSAKVHVP